MESSRKLFSAILVLMLLLVATDEMGDPVVLSGTMTCETPSYGFRGVCMFNEANCPRECRSEGFPDGRCSSLFGRCMCTKQCVC